MLIGAWFYRKARTASGFLLGDRSLNFWVTALSTHASDMSVWLFMGFPAAIFLNGFVEIWTAVGLMLFMFLSWHFVAPQIRKKSEEYNVVTLPGYFEARLTYAADQCPEKAKARVRFVSSGITIFFLVAYIAAGLVGLGRLFEEVLGVPYHLGIISGIGLIMAYTLLGGFFAVAWNDMLQAVFLLLMIVLVPYLTLDTYNVDLCESITSDMDLTFSWTGLLHIFGWGLGYFGLPHVLVKFMSIDHVKSIKRAKILGLSWQFTVLVAAISIGFIAREVVPDSTKPELIFVALSQNILTPLFAQIVLCAILAAALSTLDAQVMTVSSTVSKDLFSLSPRQTLWATRLAIVVLCSTAAALAWTNASSIYDMVYYAWTGLGCSFGPFVLVSITRRQIPANVALVGILAGAFVSGVWPFWADLKGVVPAMIPGFATGLGILWLFSKKEGYNGSADPLLEKY